MTTDNELRELIALADKATGRPWSVDWDSAEYNHHFNLYTEAAANLAPAIAAELLAAREAQRVAIERAEKAEVLADRYEEALQQIDNWAKAYPLDVFPEPDIKRVREVLAVAGITIDSVSASNMRHVIEGVERITGTALKGGAA